MTSTIILSVLALSILGIILGLAIGLISKLFGVATDPKVDLVLELLPGANCGGCGKAGCADFARALVSGEASPGQCPVSSQEVMAQIAQVLGMALEAPDKKIAVVLCGGDIQQTKVKTLYNGVNDCISAMLVAGGPKSCAYGCLGMASCARACPFNAIEIINGLAVVHNELCVGCGVCVKTCPRNLIKLVPAEAKVHIYCSSPEKAALKMKVCNVPCIACRKCVKSGEEGQFTINGFRVEVNYDNYPGEDIVSKAGCPKNCLLTAAQHLEIERNEEAGEVVA
ncbi:MAG: RnfABCDGE type electron transport complex subunit B [Victivallaceae bacterium]|nr:RnfABCDGE type electron transport complex subunit B [Victivallaceae bacterium]MDD3116317.1 RnfABCDGE type electron transport complex subunit B [Victivallaceae bacterium]MDD3702761.1 RnfABCDGE type electron transport complex subunit B [Victivallaceae bacterium]MDD4317479.1 RnfABCDGE type electron transport complex subunit B [Victivallaceae bacterium]MDD5662938.1 RnfABCDGE type electron transport complex subunit B [Victivallaceae bacterium]